EHANGPLTPDAAEDLSIMTNLLADPSTWAEPTGRLEDAVAHGVESAPSPGPATAEDARPRRQPSRRRGTRALSGLAAAAAVAIALGTLAVLHGSPSPDYSARLAATSVVPGAHASADITRNNAGFRIVLHAHGLAKLPADEYYQAWLKNAAGT